MTTNFTIELAGHRVAVNAQYLSTPNFCRDYLTEGKPDVSVTVSRDDIASELEKIERDGDIIKRIPPRTYSDAYLEVEAVNRKIAEKLVDFNIQLFHGSAIAVDGQCYIFTAKSGTGKSTHTRLWRELLGDRALMVNDDKPLLQVTDHGVIVHGTPWNGKHNLGSNVSVPLKAICILERDETNHISQITAKEALPMLLQQCYRSSDPEKLLKTLSLVDDLLHQVELYRLGCNMEPEAALVAYRGMNKGEK
jgi:hypothetical protein